jgi:type IX secretion system substrate protein
MKLKNFTPVIISLLGYVNSNAQLTITAQKTMGGRNTDYLTSLVLTSDGGSIAGGYSGSNMYAEKTENIKGLLDYWIVKLNAHRKIEWDKTIGGDKNDQLSAIQQTIDGGYILGGYSESHISGDKTEEKRGLFDYWIVKIDNKGNIEWDKTFGGSGNDYLMFVQQTFDKGYILGGYSESNIGREKSEDSRGGNDYWIVKTDSAGNIKWDKTYGGNAEDILSTIQQTKDSGYILGGYSYSNISGEKSENPRGFSDYWVIKINASGNIQWNKTYGGNKYDDLHALQQTVDGGYIFGGASWSDKSGEKSQDSKGYYDYWIVKTDSAGNIQWNRTIGGYDYDGLYALQQTKDRGYLLGGSSSSNISGDKTENSRGSNDYWVVKLDRKGKFQWDKTIGGSSSDELYGIQEIKKNHFILGGTSTSVVSGDKTGTSRGYEDYWIVYLDYISDSINAVNKFTVTEQTLNKEFSVYPNPAKDMLHVQTKNKIAVSIINQSGKILFTKIINGDETIDVSKFTPGIYYLKDNTTGNTQKITVVK